MANYLEHLTNGDIKRVVPIEISSGVTDAEKIVQTTADGTLHPSLIPASISGGRFADFNTETLTANKTLLIDDPFVQYLEPLGADRDVILPDPVTSAGRQYRILNTVTTGNRKLRLIDNAIFVLSVSKGKAILAHSDGVEWYVIELN